jgi:RNA polymerase sigma-70 factor (ECF subfamily)
VTTPLSLGPSDNLEQAFTEAYEAYADAIFRHCYFNGGNRELALEYMQEAFMKTWEYLSEGKSIENVRAFLYRTATNLMINASRKKKEVSLDELQEKGFDPGVTEDWQNRDTVAESKVVETLKKVDESYRQVLVLRYVEGLSPVEIAEVLGETANVISVRIYRGLKQLRAFMRNG